MSKEITEDFLEVDQSLPGQNFVCLSFVSPEEVLKNKNIFMVHKFLQEMGKQYGLTEDECQDKYKDFLFQNQETLEKQFYEQNEYQTTMRGLKVRGTFDTLKEAQVRAQVLQRKDPNFNVFIGQVGYWLPWDPNPLKVDKQEYAESELNTLVQKYKENQDKKDAHFRENLEYVKEQAAKQAETVNAEKAKEKAEQTASTESAVESITSSLEAADPWLARHQTSEEGPSQ